MIAAAASAARYADPCIYLMSDTIEFKGAVKFLDGNESETIDNAVEQLMVTNDWDAYPW